MAKNKGKSFEDAIRKSFEQVLDVSIDRLKDTTPIKRKRRTIKLKGVGNPSDFIVYKKPHEVYVECKSHQGNTLPFFCIRDEQWKGLQEKSLIDGVKAGAIIWFIDHDITIWVDIFELVNWRSLGNKSINVKDLDKIDHIKIDGKKKRVYFDYNMEKFLEELYL